MVPPTFPATEPPPEPPPAPGPGPQDPPPQPSALLTTLNNALNWAHFNHPDIVPPTTRVYDERQVDLDPSGYSYGIDVYQDGVTLQNGQYIGFVNVVSHNAQSSIWSWRANSILAVRDKLRFYAGVLKGAV